MGKIKGTDLSAEVLIITPQVAKSLLKTAEKNRAINRSRILRYSQAMRLDEWTLAQPLMLDADGKLLDGQNRMHAVIHANRPIKFLVIKGFVRSEVFGRVDDTGPRRLKDWLNIQGEALPDVMAVVIQMAARHEKGIIPTSGGGSFRQTPIEGVDFLESHPKIRHSVVDAPGTVTLFAPRAMLCFAHYLFAQKSKSAADAFLIDLVNGDVGGDGDPLYYLRDRLKSNRYARNKFSRTEMLALIIKTWNADRSGKKVTGLRWRTDGPKPEAFPEVA